MYYAELCPNGHVLHWKEIIGQTTDDDVNSCQNITQQDTLRLTYM